jgi:hypothetical protein
MPPAASKKCTGGLRRAAQRLYNINREGGRELEVVARGWSWRMELEDGAGGSSWRRASGSDGGGRRRGRGAG